MKEEKLLIFCIKFFLASKLFFHNFSFEFFHIFLKTKYLKRKRKIHFVLDKKIEEKYGSAVWDSEKEEEDWMFDISDILRFNERNKTSN